MPILRNKAGLGKLPAPAETGIHVIVVAERWTGVKKNLTTHPQQAVKLQAFLNLFCIPDFDLNAAVPEGEICAELESAGKKLARWISSPPPRGAAPGPPASLEMESNPGESRSLSSKSGTCMKVGNDNAISSPCSANDELFKAADWPSARPGEYVRKIGSKSPPRAEKRFMSEGEFLRSG